MSIDEWLNEQDYNSGVELYESLNGNSVLLAMFKKGANSFTRKQLERELSALNTVPETPVIVQPAKVILPDQDPDSIILLKKKKGIIYSEASHIKSQLRYMLQGPETRVACLKIVSMMKQNSTMWNIINKYSSTGIVEEPAIKMMDKDLSKLSAVELIHERNNMRTLVSKYRNKLTETTDPNRIKRYTEKLNLYIDKRNELEKLTGG